MLKWNKEQDKSAYSVSNSSLTSGVGWGEFYVTHTGLTGLDGASIPLSVKSRVRVRAFHVSPHTVDTNFLRLEFRSRDPVSGII